MAHPTWKDARGFLDRSTGKHTYGAVAAEIGTSARAVGAMMRALHKRGHHAYCPRVVDSRTGRPGFRCP